MRNLTKDEISVKVKQITEKGCLLLLYKTARVDTQILDETYGANNWVNDYKEIKGNLFCGIGVKQDDGTFIWKWDCGIESATEAEKGEASDAFKRAGFKWGIGVELYTAPFIWANVETFQEKGRWYLKDKFLKFIVSEFEVKDGKISKLVIKDNKGNIVYPNQPKKKEEPKENDKTPQEKTPKVLTLDERINNFKDFIKTATLEQINKSSAKFTELKNKADKETAEELLKLWNDRCQFLMQEPIEEK